MGLAWLPSFGGPQPSLTERKYITAGSLPAGGLEANAARAKRLKKNFTIRAMYRDGIMYLRHDIAVGDGDQIVLHELVHHFQWSSGRKYDCDGEREAEAYELQKQCAEAINEEPRVPSEVTLVVLTHCRER